MHKEIRKIKGKTGDKLTNSLINSSWIVLDGVGSWNSQGIDPS